MRGFPKSIATREDIIHCQEMVRAGDLRAEDLMAELEAIENRRYLHCPVLEMDEEKRTVIIRYCAEAEGVEEIGGTAVESVGHFGEDEMGSGDTPAFTTVRFQTPLAGTETELLVPSPADPLEEMGITEEELTDAKIELYRLNEIR